MQCRFWHKECCQTFLHILERPIVCFCFWFLYIFIFLFVCRFYQTFLHILESPIVCISFGFVFVNFVYFVFVFHVYIWLNLYVFCAKSLRESCQTSFISVKAWLFVSPPQPADYYLSSCALFSEMPHNYLPFSPQPSSRKVSTIQKWV